MPWLLWLVVSSACLLLIYEQVMDWREAERARKLRDRLLPAQKAAREPIAIRLIRNLMELDPPPRYDKMYYDAMAKAEPQHGVGCIGESHRSPDMVVDDEEADE